MSNFISRKPTFRGVSIDSKTASARLGDAAAVNPPGIEGNRWISFGNDGVFPAKYMGKIKQAVHLAYELRGRKSYTDSFDNIVRNFAQLKPLSFVEALDIAQLNYAETTTNPIASTEVHLLHKDMKSKDPIMKGFKPEGAFTIAVTSQIYIYEHALKWNIKFLAGLICHEVAHVAGCKGHMGAEIALLTPEARGYPRAPK